MIICSRCGKDNQDHYKFCLGCGAELTAAEAPPKPEARGPSVRPTASPRPVPVEMPPPPVEPVIPLTAKRATARPGPPVSELEPTVPPEATPAEAPSGSGSVSCAGCGTSNPKEFVFCGNCGARMQKASQATLFRAGRPPSERVAAPVGRARLALIRPDGSEGGSHTLFDADTVIGRGTGALFDSDGYLSPTHARFLFTGDHLVVEDAGSLNGVFVRIVDDEPLENSDVFRIGQELLRFDAIGAPQVLADGTEVLGSPNPGYWGRLSLIVGRGVDGSAFPLMGDEMILGRERGDILFSDDGYVSGTHAKVSLRGDRVYLTDLGSSNGTFARLRKPRVIPFGTFVLMGQQLFRVERIRA